MRFSTSSGCLKSGAFFSVYLGGWVWECEAFNVHIKPRSHTCLIVVSPFPIRPLVSFYSLRCGVHPHGTRPFTSSVYACLLSLCETIFKVFFVVFFFQLRSLWETATYKTKADRKKKKKNKTRVVVTFFAVNVCILFFLAIAYCNLFRVSFKSYTFFSITCMLLCIYAIVAVVTMMVCGFRPDFTIQSVTQRTGKIRKKK